MKTSSVKFARLRRMLLDLQFSESRTDRFWRFEHLQSDTIFLFRPYRQDENVNMADLVGTRNQLEWRGLLAADSFDDQLTKAPA